MRRSYFLRPWRGRSMETFSRSHNGEENGQHPGVTRSLEPVAVPAPPAEPYFLGRKTGWHVSLRRFATNFVAVVFCWVEMGCCRGPQVTQLQISCQLWCHSQMHSRMHGLIIVLFWFCLNSHWYLPYFHHYPLVAEIQKYMENRSYRLPRVGYLEDHPRTRKLLATMVIGFVPNAAVGPLPNGRTLWLRKWGPILTTWSWVIKPSNHHCPIFFRP